MEEPVIRVKDFGLVLGGKTIVEDLSFDVKAGEVFAFLGANGSGKTSTIRCLLQIYQATKGSLHVDGKPFSSERGHLIGYLPEERGLYTKAKAIDVMTYFGELKGMSRLKAQETSLGFLGQVGLSDKANMLVKKLSGGQQQKVQLGVAVINDPKVLILDEPTKGLDPVNRKLLLDIVDEHQQRGAAVIYITHLMEEVERLADRLLILKEGKARAYGSVKDVKKQFESDSIEDIFVSVYNEKSNEATA